MSGRSVLLTSAAPTGAGSHPRAHLDLNQMKSSAAEDSFGVHRCVDDAREADLVLFVETSGAAGYYFEHVRRHPLYKQDRERCYIFSSMDRVVPLLPGIFASIESKQYREPWTRGGHYLGVREDPDFVYEPADGSRYLFSFIGSARTHGVRDQMMGIDAENGLLIDVDREREAAMEGEAPRRSSLDYRRRYLDAIRDSAFVLCPRGGGASTFRLFESMMTGRAPVIVSDAWVPPEGPAWDEFSVRVPEAEVGEIPRVLEDRFGEAAEMGRRAREAWLGWFSPQASFHRCVEWCVELEQLSHLRAGLGRFKPYAELLEPYHMARRVAKRLGHGKARRSEDA